MLNERLAWLVVGGASLTRTKPRQEMSMEEDGTKAKNKLLNGTKIPMEVAALKD
jgi:hypothetical protein